MTKSLTQLEEEHARFREALERIAVGDYDLTGSNPKKRPSTIAKIALGWEWSETGLVFPNRKGDA